MYDGDRGLERQEKDRRNDRYVCPVIHDEAGHLPVCQRVEVQIEGHAVDPLRDIRREPAVRQHDQCDDAGIGFVSLYKSERSLFQLTKVQVSSPLCLNGRAGVLRSGTRPRRLP